MEASAASDLRVESRNNIFVIAVLDLDCGSATPVRVRNLSQNGALVEASVLPEAGTSVLLKRGSLCVEAQVVWVDQQRAGLRLAKPVTVSEWLPYGPRASRQQLADELVHQRRSTKTQPSAAAASPPQNSSGGAELTELAKMLKRAVEELALDHSTTTRHPLALQIIDGVIEALTRSAAVKAEPSG
jgi:hypothetical protein